jgi:thioredoxin 1
MIRLLAIVLVGAGAGALLGSTRSCETGGCPLTATPLRGAIYGAILAGLVGFAFVGRSGTKAASHAPLSPHLVVVDSSAAFDTEVLQAKGVVLVDFYADWCGPCQRLLPVMSELADEWAGSVKVVKVNVDKVADVAKTRGVSSIPDVRIFLDGKEKEQLIGLQPKDTYLNRVAALRGAEPAAPAAAPTPAAPPAE